MPRVLLIRPNDFIADAMAALLTRLGLEALRIGSSAELERTAFADVAGAVVSTAVTSVMPLSFREGVAAARRRAPTLPLVATTMLKDASKAAGFVALELAGVVAVDPIVLEPQSLGHAALGTSRGVLLLRKEDVEAASSLTLQVLRKHLGLDR